MIILTLYCLLVIGPPLLAILVTWDTAGPRARSPIPEHTYASGGIVRDLPPPRWRPYVEESATVSRVP